MTNKQYEHVQAIGEEFITRVATKYEKGAIEHNNDLWCIPTIELLDQAMDECIDQWVYLFTLKQELTKVSS